MPAKQVYSKKEINYSKNESILDHILMTVWSVSNQCPIGR